MGVKTVMMRRALSLAKRGWGKTSPNPMVGAVIVRDGVIVGEGYHHAAGKSHAEVEALRAAGSAARGADIYVTLEPCSTHGRTPPCTEALIAAGIRRVFVGTRDPNPKHAGRAAEIFEAHGIVYESGVLEAACTLLNEDFFHWVTLGRPFILLKMAMTLDGKIATADGDSQWVTGDIARRRVQKLRQWADAVWIGGGTARIDKPSLRVRVPSNWRSQPRRLVASSCLSSLELSDLMPGEPVPEVIDCSSESLVWSQVLSWGKAGMKSILVEGGGEFAALLLRMGLIDKVEFHIAPKILGGCRSRPVIGGTDPLLMADAIPLERVVHFKLGTDFATSGYPVFRR